MGQQPTLDISALPGELFNLIASFLDTKSQLEFAHTCKTVYAYHNQQYREKKVALLYGPPSNIHSYYINRKALARWLSEPGWAAVKAIIEGISTDSQNNNSHPISALFLNELFQLPNELNYESIHALILDFPFQESPTLVSISFSENFSNLKILRLKNVKITENTVLVLSKLSLLKVISLKYCKVTDDHLLKIFETCTTLDEIELYTATQYAIPIMFSRQVKRLRIKGYFRSMQIDLSRCTQLQSL
jgi:hypothetical protein